MLLNGLFLVFIRLKLILLPELRSLNFMDAKMAWYRFRKNYGHQLKRVYIINFHHLFVGFVRSLKGKKNKSTLGNSPPPLLNLKLLSPQGQIIEVKCLKSQ